MNRSVIMHTWRIGVGQRMKCMTPNDRFIWIQIFPVPSFNLRVTQLTKILLVWSQCANVKCEVSHCGDDESHPQGVRYQHCGLVVQSKPSCCLTSPGCQMRTTRLELTSLLFYSPSHPDEWIMSKLLIVELVKYSWCPDSSVVLHFLMFEQNFNL